MWREGDDVLFDGSLQQLVVWYVRAGGTMHLLSIAATTTTYCFFRPPVDTFSGVCHICRMPQQQTHKGGWWKGPPSQPGTKSATSSTALVATACV